MHTPNRTPPPEPTPLRAIAIILAYGVLRLQQRQNVLDNSTEQSVHHGVLTPKGDAP